MSVTVQLAMGNSLLVPARDEVMSVTVQLAMGNKQLAMGNKQSIGSCQG